MIWQINWNIFYADHGINTVYTFQEILLNEIKEFIPNLKKVSYFTDGAAGQYKNKSNFINLCHHELDFGCTAIWNFSATRKVYLFIPAI